MVRQFNMHLVTLVSFCILFSVALGDSDSYSDSDTDSNSDSDSDSDTAVEDLDDLGVDDGIGDEVRDDGVSNSEDDGVADKTAESGGKIIRLTGKKDVNVGADDDDANDEVNDEVHSEADEGVNKSSGERSERHDPPKQRHDSNDGVGDIDYDDNIQLTNSSKTNSHEDSGDLDVKQYLVELADGDLTEFMGSSAHHHEPRYFKNLGRRFVPLYHYKQKKTKHHKSNAKEVLAYILSANKRTNRKDQGPIPIEAPREVVLAVMKKNTQKFAAKPSNPTEEVIREYMLRSGDYWDSVWKEDGPPNKGLRVGNNLKHKRKSKSQPITAQLVPGTKLYKLLSSIVKKSPKLVYIINK